MFRAHPFHLVDTSPWPILSAGGSFLVAMSLLFWMHEKQVGLFFLASVLLSLITMKWWRDITRESSYLSFHLSSVQRGLRISMSLFITSEVFFFLGFFWTFFHSSLAVTNSVSYMWPPSGLEVLDPMSVPLLNTIVLLSSSVTVTYSHNSVLSSDFFSSVVSLVGTLILGVFFTLLQLMEYMEAPVNISDSVYGSIFYMATGFHSFHVIVSSIFLSVCLIRMVSSHLQSNQHVSYECSIWYWHFVDVVWVFLYLCVYWWGSV